MSSFVNESKDSENYDEILNQQIDLDANDSNESEDDNKLVDDQKENIGWTLMSHKSKFRMRWDLVVILLALYNCVSIPFEVAFGNISDHVVMEIFEYGIDVLFFVDVIFNFRTTYINPKTGTEVISGKKIAWNYVVRGRFWVDLLASIPFEVIIGFFVEMDQGNLQLLGLLKLVRLLRLGRIITYMKFKSSVKFGFKIFQLLFFLLLLVHWIGCSWYMLVDTRDSWLPPKDLDAGETDFYDLSRMR